MDRVRDTLGDRARVPVLVLSTLLVMAVSVAVDLVADEPPTHALTVGLVAAVVGLGRLWTGGDRRAVIVAVAVAVLGQPAVHTIGAVAHAGVDAVARDHDWPVPFAAVAAHLAAALVVVAVAASEPVAVLVVVALVWVLARLVRAVPDVTTSSAVRARVRAEPHRGRRRRVEGRHALRRGPPRGTALAVRAA